MNSQTVLEYQWSYLLSFLPAESELEKTARECGAFRRRRAVDSASELLRLALAYGFCGLSLRQTAAWAEVAGVASISDVALLNRLRSADRWLGHLLGNKLAERAATSLNAPRSLRLRIVDATTVSKPGSTGTDWRVHLGFDLATLAIDHVELTDARGGETLCRFTFEPGDVVVGDRGYAHRRGLWSVLSSGADFLVRLNWQNIPLQRPNGRKFEVLDALRSLPEARVGEFAVRVTPQRKEGIPAIAARLVAVRKSEAAAEESRRRVLKERSKKGRAVDPRTLEAASYVFVLTSVPEERMDAAQVLEAYRLRWQIELAFKRLKSLLHLNELPARDPALARSYIFAKLLAALLLEDFTDHFLSFSPWGFRLVRAPTEPLADSKGAA